MARGAKAEWCALQLEMLRQENARLHFELNRARTSSGLETSTSGNRALQTIDSGPLAPPVTIKPLAFAVDRFIAVGEPICLH